MNYVIGVIAIVVAIYFLYRTVKLWPPGIYRSQMSRPSSRADIAAGLIVVVAMLASGIIILTGASLVWLLVGVAGGLLWALANA